MSDPPAPDLGAQDPHLAELYRILARCVGTYQSIALSPQDAVTWLQHVDAQAARLAAVSDVLMYAISIICNVEHPTVTQDMPWEPLRRRFLDQAHAALGPPATEMAARQEPPGAAGAGRPS